MISVREPTVAGSFYPADPDKLQNMLQRLLSQAAAPRYCPKALIVPHAGYQYSGPVAASGYVTLPAIANQISRVILLGPAHRKAFRGIAVPSSQAFRTPLGDVPLDRAALEELLQRAAVCCDDDAHMLEHSLEVQLPFLQSQLHDFLLVPLLVGDTTARDVAGVIQSLWGGAETLLVISSDLSHFLDYSSARIRDTATSQAIESLACEEIGPADACGCNPVNGLLMFAREHGLQIKRLDLRNSGDTSGSRERVVGYGAFLLAEHDC